VDEIRSEVRRRVADLGPSGYIVAPVHVVQADVPPENVIAVSREVASLNTWIDI